MMKTFRLVILYSWIFFSCNTQDRSDVMAAPLSSNYPDTNLDFQEELYAKNDTLTFRAKVEIKLDSNKVSSWLLNGKRIRRSELLPKLEELQLRFPKERRNHIAINLGIDKSAKIHEFIELRDSLRIGNYLRAFYLNSNNQRLGVSFPTSHKARPSKLIPAPPPPPLGIDESICLCCEEKGKFRTSVFNAQSEYFDNSIDCMKGSNLNEYFTFVHTDKDVSYWEGNELNLSVIADSLQTKHTNCSKPNRYITIIKVDVNSKFESYLDLYSTCRKVYVKQWNKESIKMFGMPYPDLPRKDKKKIRAKYPLIISESFN